MTSTSDAIRIRIRHNEPDQSFGKGAPRDQFWSILKRQERYSDRSLESLETELVREFGQHLRRELVNRISQGMRDAERALYGSEMEEMLHEYRHFFHFPHEKWPTFYPSDPLTRMIEFRQQLLREVPAVRLGFERLASLSDVFFSTRIDGYSSLNLALAVSQIKKLAYAFDADFDSFRVFLDAFVPEAFGDVFDSDSANRLVFDIDIPSSFQAAFSPSALEDAAPTPHQPPQVADGTKPQKSDAAQKAEWLWKLANGSLLVPLILALIVLYFGFKEVAALRISQYEAIKPILDHHMQLLKEDRERLALQLPAPTQAPPVTAASTNATAKQP